MNGHWRTGGAPRRPGAGVPAPTVCRRAVLGAGPATGVAGVLAGCLPGATPPGAETKALAPADLTFTTWVLPPGAQGAAMVEEAIPAFQARQPQVTVRVEPIPGTSAEATLEKLTTLVAGGAPPDLSLVRPHHVGYLASRGVLVAVDDRLARARRSWRSDFFEAGLARCTWRQKVWGLPANLLFLFHFYNQDLLTAAGVPAPDGTWTWERWLEVARRLTNPPDGGGQRTFGGDQPVWHNLVWAWGGEILNAAETACVLNRSPAPEALQWRVDLTQRYGIAPRPEDLGQQTPQRLFTAGRLGFWSGSNQTFINVSEQAPFRWGLTTFPRGKAGSITHVFGANHAIFQGTGHVDAAWALLADISYGEGMKTLMARATVFPPVRALARQELLPAYQPAWLDVTLKAGETARQPYYHHPQYWDMDRIVNQQLEPVWRGERRPIEAADEIVRQVNALLKQA